MAFLTPPQSAQAPLDPNTAWITPEQQLVDLTLPIAQKLKNIHINRFTGCSEVLLNQVTACAVRSILKRSDLPTEDNGPETRVSTLMELTVESILEPPPLPQSLTTWYKGLKPIHKLPEKIPPLPGNIHEILNSTCPKQICRSMKADGTFYTMGEKCTLTVVPEELRSLNEFERVVQLYGEEQSLKYNFQYDEEDRDVQNKNPLKFRYISDEVREEHGDTRFGPTYWQFHTDSVLEESRNQSVGSQIVLVAGLAKDTLVDWQVPELRDTIATIFLRQIATGESLYQHASRRNRYLSTYTNVKEQIHLHTMAVGAHNCYGLHVYTNSGNTNQSLGVGARWKLSGLMKTPPFGPQ